MLVCGDCGKVYDESTIYGRYSDICDCGGGVFEAEECFVCGEYFFDEHRTGICPQCMIDERTVDNALGIGEEYKEEIKINSFVAYALDEKKINEILIDYIRRTMNDSDKSVREFLDDEFSLAEYLKEVYK